MSNPNPYAANHDSPYANGSGSIPTEPRAAFRYAMNARKGITEALNGERQPHGRAMATLRRALDLAPTAREGDGMVSPTA